MSELEDEINLAKDELERYRGWVYSCKKKLEKLNSLTQPTMSEFLNGIDNYFSLSIDNKEYEHELGGDGRSAPWSEKRTGEVATVKIKQGIWLSKKQEDIIESYIQYVHKVKSVEFIES